MGANELDQRMSGAVLAPGDDGYDTARATHNARFDSRPDLIARCAGADDVATAVHHAREQGLALTVKGGGHSYAGTSAADGGLLIDLAEMDGVEVDPAARTATVGAGATWAQVDAATQEHGLATTGATASIVGVAGYTLGGGTGNLSRLLGLACDNLRAVEIVTADGERHRASADDNPELFWAVRGAGHNFGVVTSFEFELAEVGPEVLTGQIVYPFDDAAAMLRFYRDFVADAPEELQCYPFMFRIPPVDPFPEESHGQPALNFVVFHTDPDALDVVQPLRELGDPILEAVGAAPYAVAQQTFDEGLPAGQRYYTRAHDVEEITDEMIEVIVDRVPEIRGAFTAAYFEPMDGAIGRVDPGETAVGRRREAGYSFHTLGGWMDPSDDGDVMGWVHGIFDALAPHAMGSAYVNLLGEDEADRLPEVYSDLERLRRLKAEWDAENLFAPILNIEPAS